MVSSLATPKIDENGVNSRTINSDYGNLYDTRNTKNRWKFLGTYASLVDGSIKLYEGLRNADVNDARILD